jgi:hypothetical protein
MNDAANTLLKNIRKKQSLGLTRKKMLSDAHQLIGQNKLNLKSSDTKSPAKTVAS